MKYVIDMLRSRASNVRKSIADSTSDAVRFTKELKAAEAARDSWNAKVKEKQANINRACLRRNENQRVLNEIEAAIAKLEAE